MNHPTLNISVRLFAAASDKLGRQVVELVMTNPATVGQLRAALAAQFPDLAPLVPHLLVTLDRQYTSDETLLRTGAEVACFPPVSGG